MTSPFGTLGTVPVDVLVEMFAGHLDLPDIARLMCLNSQFAQLLVEDDVWRIIWSRYFPDIDVPTTDVKKAFKELYESQSYIFGEWKVLFRRGVYFIHNTSTSHTVTAYITADSYTISANTHSMTWDVQRAQRSAPLVKQQENSGIIASGIPDFCQSYSLTRKRGHSTGKDYGLAPLPPRGRFHSVQYVVAETVVPGGSREEYLHLWHVACPVVLLLSKRSNGWSAIRVRKARVMSELEILAGDGKNEEVVFYPHTSESELAPRFRDGCSN